MTDNTQTITNLAKQIGAALNDYRPESLNEILLDMPQFGDAITAIANGFRALAERVNAEWPVQDTFVAAINAVADDLDEAAATANAGRGALPR